MNSSTDKRENIKVEEIEEVKGSLDELDIPVKREEETLNIESVSSFTLRKSVALKKPKPNLIVTPDPEDPNFYCHSCKSKLLSRRTYLTHLRNIHRMYIKNRKYTKNSAIQPDPKDPNYHCRSCNCKFNSRIAYKYHLIHWHKMSLPNSKSYPKSNHKAKSNPDIAADPNDPNYYCHSCNRSYPSCGRYRQHLRYVHTMDLPNLRGKWRANKQ